MTAAFRCVRGCHSEERINLFCVTSESRAETDEGMLWVDSFKFSKGRPFQKLEPCRSGPWICGSN